jgi:hypothetical protein
MGPFLFTHFPQIILPVPQDSVPLPLCPEMGSVSHIKTFRLTSSLQLY